LCGQQPAVRFGVLSLETTLKTCINTAKTMRALIVVAFLLAGFSLRAQGDLYTGGGTFDNITGAIPNGSTAGWSTFYTFSGINGIITDVSVKLNISGGFNGDFYAYLSYDNIQVPLLNRVGVGSAHPGSSVFGYADSGLNITLTSSGNDVHWYQDSNNPGGGELTGIWQTDGRSIDPLSQASAFDNAGRVTFDLFNNMNPNGTWRLFVADLSSGGDESEILSWELDIRTTPVPEPGNLMGLFAALYGFWRLGKSKRLQNAVRRSSPR
jgi:hypothetical protein